MNFAFIPFSQSNISSFTNIFIIFLIILGLFTFFRLIYLLFTYFNTKRHYAKYRQFDPKHSKINQKILANYRKEGLNEQDINYFRKTMYTALKEISTIENLSQKNSTLNEISDKNNLLSLLHTFFKAIVNNPSQIDRSGNFLFKELPALETLFKKYTKIAAHTYQDEKTKEVLQLSEEAIQRSTKNIKNEYQEFIKDDLENLKESANTL